MKFIFLDLDGVLNTGAYLLTAVERQDHHPDNLPVQALDPVLVARLRALVNRTDTELVISSDWRYSGMPMVLRAFAWSGWPEPPVFGSTARLGHRGSEIRLWLEHHQTLPGVQSFVILDDNVSELDEFKPNTVRVDRSVGLSDADVARACEILGTPAR